MKRLDLDTSTELGLTARACRQLLTKGPLWTRLRAADCPDKLLKAIVTGAGVLLSLLEQVQDLQPEDEPR